MALKCDLSSYTSEGIIVIFLILTAVINSPDKSHESVSWGRILLKIFFKKLKFLIINFQLVNCFFMKKMSILKTTMLIAGGWFLSLIAMQCTKVGVNANALDRTFKSIPDTTQFSPFYDETKITPSDPTTDVNDKIVVKGVQGIIKEYCGISTCHGGPIEPKLVTYNDIKKFVTPGNPDASKLWNLLTTNELDKAMPPVNATHELSLTDKTIIYNWIKNGAKEFPDLADYRPAAVKVILTGCTSGNCHNQATSAGVWARSGLIPGLVSADTSTFAFIRASGITYYCQLSNPALLNSVWSAYKDSVRRFYADTLANASLRPYKTFGTPVNVSSVRGSLSNYDDILLDILYPKSARSNSSIQYTDGSGKKFYVKGNYLNVTSSLVSRIDSTLLLANPYTGIFATAHQGDMAYGDGGVTPSDIALVKAWYFADPNIPDVWKYGSTNAGIFKYRKTGTLIRK
jgi:hypothetical protein